ncbi:hypothetical protein [Desulfobulbus propionicus]
MGQEAMQRNVIRSRDIIGSTREVVAFLRDVAGARGIREELTGEGLEGLSRILGWVNEELAQAVDLLEHRPMEQGAHGE